MWCVKVIGKYAFLPLVTPLTSKSRSFVFNYVIDLSYTCRICCLINKINGFDGQSHIEFSYIDAQSHIYSPRDSCHLLYRSGKAYFSLLFYFPMIIRWGRQSKIWGIFFVWRYLAVWPFFQNVEYLQGIWALKANFFLRLRTFIHIVLSSQLYIVAKEMTTSR